VRGTGFRLARRRKLRAAVAPPDGALDHVRAGVSIRDPVLNRLQQERKFGVGQLDVDWRSVHCRQMSGRHAVYTRIALFLAAIAAIVAGTLLSSTPNHDLTFPLIVAGLGTIVILLVLNHAIWLWDMLRFTARSNYTRRP
jgi:hypothetical protein